MVQGVQAVQVVHLVQANQASILFQAECAMLVAAKTFIDIYIFIGPESDHWLCLMPTQNLLRLLLLPMLMMSIVLATVCCRFGS